MSAYDFLNAGYVVPITRESFLAAYVDAEPWKNCRDASSQWTILHSRDLLPFEIDEDPS